MRFGRRNRIAFILALVALTVGYVLLSRGSTVAAPLLLVLGYVVLIPVSLML